MKKEYTYKDKAQHRQLKKKFWKKEELNEKRSQIKGKIGR